MSNTVVSTKARIVSALQAIGNDGDDTLNGSATADTLDGGLGNDTLDGKAGADKMTGGLGNDVYYVDNTGDQVIELADQGSDTVNTTLATYTLGANVENLKYTGTAAFTGTGNALNNKITGGNGGANKLDGGAGDDLLQGGWGDDSLQGGLGDDGFIVTVGKDTIDGGAGNDGALIIGLTRAAFSVHRPNATDIVLTYVGGDTEIPPIVTTYRNVESITFSDGTYTLAELQAKSSTTGNDSLTGSDGNDILNGYAGVDTLAGGLGDDTYVVDVPNDVVTEAADEGTDTVQVALAAAGTYTLGANVENGTVTAAAAIAANITGNALANKLVGNAAANTLLGGAGNDTLDGGAGADKLSGGTGDDTYVVDNATDAVTEAAGEGTDTVLTALATYTLGANLEGLTFTGTAAVTGTGNALNNTIKAGSGGSKIDGGAGNDSLYGGAGADSLAGGLDNDTVYISAGKDTIDGGAGTDTVTGFSAFENYTVSRPNAADTVLTDKSGNVSTVRNVEALVFDGVELSLEQVQDNVASISNDSLIGTDLNDTMNGGLGADTMAGGIGNDTYVIDNLLDVVVEQEGSGTDLLQVGLTAAGTYTLAANVENATVTAAAAIAVNLTGNALDNKLAGNAAANTLLGGAGNDTLDGGAGADKLTGGAGNDTYIVDIAGDVVTEAAGEGTDSVETSVATYVLGANVENLTYTGTAAFTGTGNTGNNYIIGGNGGNKIDGGAGNDTVLGGSGADSLTGGAGDDFIGVQPGGKDTIDGGDGNDVLQLAESFLYVATRVSATDTLLTHIDGKSSILVRNVESFAFDDGTKTLAEVRDNTASGGNDSISGSDNGETLDGGVGADTLAGGKGDDSYILDNPLDVVIEDVDQGYDTAIIKGAGTFVMAANLEQADARDSGSLAINISGNALDNTIYGNAGANTIIGGAGGDTLIGGAGADKLSGGTGDDFLYVQDAGDVLTEAVGEGTDTAILMTATYTLAANVENLLYAGTVAFTATGNALNNKMTAVDFAGKMDGAAGNDTLIGGNGNDSLIGGLGDDSFETHKGKDTIEGGDGTDTLTVDGTFAAYIITRPTATDTVLTDSAGNSYTVRGVENFVFSDTSKTLSEVQNNIASIGNDVIKGGSSADTLNGGTGVDTMIGGDGNDTYVVDVAGDVITENADEGTDLAQVAFTAAGTYVLGANVENGTVTAAAAIAANITGNVLANKLVGNAAANTLIGGAGNDTLDGGAGADKLTGGTGDDTYVVDIGGDVVTEAAGEGTDTVQTSLTTYLLAANVEVLAYTGSIAFTGTGNALDNTITGGNGGNKIDGGAGADKLTGGTGADSLIGGLGNDTLTAGGGKDTIDGGDGTDVLQGLSTFDSYTITRPTVTDTVLTDKSGNVITVRGVESLVFDGVTKTLAEVQDNIVSPGNDNLHGDTGPDTLNGGLGSDTLAGGDGDDTYVVDVAGDVITELADQGTDLAQVAFTAAGTYVLGDNVENGTITAAATIAANITGNVLNNKLVGNAAANTLIGGAGDDTLDGGAGADKLTGGAGDDTYVVDIATDAVTEAVGEGLDTVQTALATYVLAANVEVLNYTGSAAFTGTGNAGDNVITGGNGGNKLDGGAGNDYLAGGSGADSLTGGLGNDSFAGGGGKDTIDGGDGADTLGGLDAFESYTITRPTASDTVLTGAGGVVITVRGVESFDFDGQMFTLAELQDNIASPGNDNLHGEEGDVNDTINGGLGNDTMAGGLGNDTYVAESVGDVVVELEDEGTDVVQVALTAAGTYVLGANVENGTVTAAAAIAANITGNALDNKLTGNAGANTLTGGAGNDTLDGGAGADKLIGGTGNDTYYIDVAGDTITEAAGEGTDTVVTTAATYTLAANVEGLNFIGSGAFTGIGNALDNSLDGGSGGSKLDGGAGNDSLHGGGGTDSLTGGAGDDIAYGFKGKDTFDGGDGTDVLDGLDSFDQYTITRPTASDTVLTDKSGNSITVRNVENFNFDGDVLSLAEVQDNIASPGNDNLHGSDDGDTLNGGLGADTMAGRLGDDTYVAENIGDVAVELEDEGHDVVQVALTAAGTYVLGANVEDGVVTAAATIAANITGNALDNKLVGNAAVNTLAGGAGNDTLDGGAGADKLSGGLGDDTYIVDIATDTVTEAADEGYDTLKTGLATYTLGANVEELLYTGSAAFTGIGNGLDNLIDGGNGGSKLDGGAGSDTLQGGTGADSLIGGVGDDTLVNSAGKDTLDGGAGDDILAALDIRDNYTVTRPNATDVVLTHTSGQVLTVRNVEEFGFDDGPLSFAEVVDNIASTGNDVLHGDDGDANDTINGGLGNDTMDGGLGDDVYVVDNPSDVIIELPDEGDDTVQVAFTAAGTFVMADNLENAVITAAATVAANVTGNELDNAITGNAAANTLLGGAGNDSLNGGAGADKMNGGAGDDLYLVDNAGDAVNELEEDGIDKVETTLATYTLAVNVEQLTFIGSAAVTGTGNALDNEIHGGTGANKLDGGAGNDTLYGADGADSLTGGAGDDTFYVATGKDTVDGGAGLNIVVVAGALEDYKVTRPNATDTVITNGSNVVTLRNVSEVHFDGGDIQTIEELQYNIRSDGNDHLFGDDANNTIDGGLGADTMTGNGGDDTYVLDNVGDVVMETPGNGHDLVQVTKAGAYVLADFVEDGIITSTAAAPVSLTGNMEDNLLTGNALANTLAGGEGNDTLVGGAGNDTLRGGMGDDVYNVDVSADSVVELENEGIDTVTTTAGIYTLSANVENLHFIASTGAFTGTGNALDNAITAGNGGSKLDGGLGNDTLTGGSGADSLIGGAGDDYLSAGAGKDTVDGGAGEMDTVALSGEFLDYSIVRTTATDWVFTDALGVVTTVRNVEQFEFAGMPVSLEELQESVGGSGADELFGTPGDDKLDGGLGNDTMTGDMGDDIYVLSAIGDVVHEDPGGGEDTVLLNFTAAAVYVMADEVEKAVVTAANTIAVSVTGNDSDNEIMGNGAANTLRGGGGNDSLFGAAGNDTMFGGDGDDSYQVSEAGDVVTELADEGMMDRVYVQGALASYTLGANVEELSFDGTVAFTGTGNALNNYLGTEGEVNVKFDGAAGDDLLVGGYGDDSLIGGLGDDMLDAGLGGVDTVDGGSGEDVLRLGHDFGLYTVVRLNSTDVMLTLAVFEEETSVVVRNVESFMFFDGSTKTLEELTTDIPGAGADTLTGTPGPDFLNGGPGADSMAGGDGDDIYFVDNAGDVVVEAVEEGEDKVYVTLASGTYAAPANVEYLQLLGHGAASLVGSAFDDKLVGNDAANKLTGGPGNDTLDGGGGLDTLLGGAGNDFYEIKSALAVVTEAVGEGHDVIAIMDLASYTLPTNVEVLDYTGHGAFSGTGNAQNNNLAAMFASSSVLDGGAGNDTLQGGDGDDSILGGLGDDELWAGVMGSDVLDGGAGTDLAMLGMLGDYDIKQVGADLQFKRFMDDSVITVRNVENFDLDGELFTLAELIAVITPPM